MFPTTAQSELLTARFFFIVAAAAVVFTVSHGVVETKAHQCSVKQPSNEDDAQRDS